MIVIMRFAAVFNKDKAQGFTNTFDTFDTTFLTLYILPFKTRMCFLNLKKSI
jgi:hypothetical protein